MRWRAPKITWAFVAWSLTWLASGLAPVLADSPASQQLESQQLEFFESKVRPLLVEHCYACHSSEAEQVEAGLLLDSKWGWETGGDSGPAIVPGEPDQSLLIHAIRYEEEVVSAMPPRSKLAAEQIATLERWVEMGAPDPRPKVSLDGGRRALESFNLQQRVGEHWSWQALSDPEPPVVRDEAWPGNVVDRFILASLEEVGLQPAAPADRRRWLRRLYFDLIGLPPTPEQIDSFLADSSPDALAKVVDQLLDSKHFGEKWARHWLDLVRYAETYGHEFDYPIPGASEYRDYVIRALNADVPYDQFIREHIAGDSIDPPRRHPTEDFNESVIGTGFWYLHEATHAPTDVLGNEAAIMDNQLDVFGKAFLGLTIACARCHDHKFDAISTADYYALTAYLQSSCRQVIDLDPGREREALTRRINEQRRLAAESLLSSLKESPHRRQELIESLKAVTLKSQAAFKIEDPIEVDETEVIFANFTNDGLPPGWSTSGLAFQAIGSQFSLRSDGSVAMPGTVDSGVAGRKQVGVLRSPTFEITTENIHLRMKATADVTVQVVIDNYHMAPFNDLLFRGTFLRGKETDTDGQWQWKRLSRDLKKYLGHRAYLEFIDDGEGSIAIDTILFSNRSDLEHPKGRELDRDELDQAVAAAVDELQQGGSPRWLAAVIDEGRLSLQELVPSTAERIKEASEIAERLPPTRFAVAMAQGTQRDASIYIRGSHTNLGERVPARFLEALGAKLGSRRELADQVASPENPLTARVIVNRIWHHLFGRGLVPTVDDFGPQGQPPSHPELLDWLARDFLEAGWSIKHTIRSIVLSQTYQQDSVANGELDSSLVAQVDPTNVRLHRMPVRRLPAESIRDAMFAVSGRLDLTPFGPSVPTHRTPFMSGRGARQSGPLDGNGRRSIYLAVYRNFLSPFMLTFDTPSPFGPQGRRSDSNVPAQALALLNDPMVVEQAAWWGKRVAKEHQGDVAQTISQMVGRAHGIEPTVDQLAELEAYLNQQVDDYGELDERAWTDLAHALFNMKAFYFLQ